jgi:hypothetical protein
MVIDSVTVSSGPAYWAGVFTDFFIDPGVRGSGIASVMFSTQSGLSVSLVQDADGTWLCGEPGTDGPCEDFFSLSEINDLGDLTFSFQGMQAEIDTIVVQNADYDTGSGQVGFPVISAPTPGETGVSRTPTFIWNAAPGWVDAILTSVELAATGENVDEELLPPVETSWMPTGLIAAIQREFDLSFFDGFFFEDSRMSSDGRSYLFSSGFEAYNGVSFTTVPGALPIAGWAAGLLSLALAFAGVVTLQHRRRR